MYNRALSNQVNRLLSLGASGWVYGSTFVLYDQESESLWYPYPEEKLLRCISGQFVGSTLKEITAVRTNWQDWFQSHPKSEVLIP